MSFNLYKILSLLVTTLLPSQLAAELFGHFNVNWKVSPPVPTNIGDVVVRKGHGVWTRFFIQASTREKRFSHVGIVVESGLCTRIIHSEGNDVTGVGCVKMDLWHQFFADADECAIFRHENSDNVAAAIVEKAKARLGVPFDYSFDMSDTNSLYCSEFVRLAINHALRKELIGFSMVHGHPIVAIDDIYRREFLRIFDSSGKILKRKSDSIAVQSIR